MPEDDDFIEITLDDDAEEDGDVIDVTLDGHEEAPASPPPATATPLPPKASPAPDESSDLPMVSGGECPRCGYALRPLETECPRCARLGPAAAAAPSPAEHAPAPASPPEVDGASRTRRGCLGAGVVGIVALLLAALAVPIAMYMQPSERAKREYRLGLECQLQADFEGARMHYQAALALDPSMGLAAFSMGTTYLGIGDPGLVQSVQAMSERAARGHTRELDLADEWFRKTIEIGRVLPPSVRLLDQRIRTPAQLRAFAHASMALTAFIRYSAALQADALDDAQAWMAVAYREAQAAMVDDPQNPAGEQILRSVSPLIPPM